MVSTQHTQSLTDFRANATETRERLRQTKEAEIITVNGEAKAVIMSPQAYDNLMGELEFRRDIESMRMSLREVEEGKVMEAGEFFRQLRSRLLEMKTQQEKKAV